MASTGAGAGAGTGAGASGRASASGGSASVPVTPSRSRMGSRPGTSATAATAEASTPLAELAREVIDKYDDFESSGDDDEYIAPRVARKPKAWALEYQTPFVTCAHCNQLNFFDAERLKRTMHNTRLEVELERCTGCGRAIVFATGAKDLYEEVTEKRRARIEREKARKRGAAFIQRVFRGMKGRQLARQKRIERAEWLRRINLGAREMQRVVRGRIGRKIARVERALKRIKNAVDMVVAEALRMRSSDGKKRHVFWYRRPAEKKLVYHNYRLFVDRTGNMPPLHVVEANYIELEARVHTLETNAANIVQKVFRGTVSRMFVKELMMENARIFSVRHTNVILLQRWWRECSAYRLVDTMRYAQVPPQIMKVYKQQRFREKEKLGDKHMHMKVKAHYKHEIKQARGAFMTGKVAYGSHGGKNLYAFSQSAYKSDTRKCASLIKGLLSRRRAQLDRKTNQLKRNARHNRRVDKLLKLKPKLKRYDYLAKRPTVPPPTKKVDRLIEKDRICHFEQLATVIM